jgi:CO dehydrogenase/acetyl-CoA synthase epsilon subunit
MSKKYEILELLVSFCRFVNLQIVRTKTFIRKYRTKGINQRGHALQQMRKLTSFITETFWAVTHHNLY